MISSFADKEAQKIFSRQVSTKLPRSIQSVAYRKLLMLQAAVTINDLRIPPSNHLEKLKGNRKSQYSIRINKQWRICFTWQNDSAHNVTILDYHA